jgi:N-glycosylase/DNA lyase
MRIRLSKSTPFNLDATLCCGQTFRWDKQGQWWYGVVMGKAFKIRQTSSELEFENADADFVKDYFGLRDDLPRILLQIGKDKQINGAIEMLRGLRILRQDPWECLISYICATYKNIAAIKGMLLNLSKKFGDKTTLNGYDFYTFPTLENLAKASASELAKCGLGYRAKYVHETARIVQENGFDLERLKRMPYEKAKAQLLDLPGVGLKVADCILLFSLDKLEAFPVDVWIRRVILRHYSDFFPSEFITKMSNKKSLTDREYEKLNLFGTQYFGKYAGYAQEYLYHHERTNK